MDTLFAREVYLILVVQGGHERACLGAYRLVGLEEGHRAGIAAGWLILQDDVVDHAFQLNKALEQRLASHGLDYTTVSRTATSPPPGPWGQLPSMA